MPQAVSHIPDVSTFAANVVVFLAAVGAAVAGSLAMVKKIKAEWDSAFTRAPGSAAPPGGGNAVETVTQQRMVGTLLMETATATMLTESNRAATAAMIDLQEAVEDLKVAVCHLRDEARENRHEMQIQRVRRD